MGIPVQAGDVTVNVDMDNRRVTVDVESGQRTYFARVFSPDDVTIGAEGIAEASPTATRGACTKPWFIPNTALGISDACANCMAGEVLIANGELTTYGLNQLGRQFTVKAGNPQASIAPGQFYAIDLPDSGGGNDYRTNIETCAAGLVGCHEWYSVKPGNMVGPTKQGVTTLVGDPPRDTFLEVGRYKLSAGYESDVSDALVIAPVWDTCNTADFCPTGSFPSGKSTVQVIGFALLFLEGVQGDDVIARLINVIPCGASGSGDTGAGAFSVPVRLIRLP
jgi:hypothetical protein